MFLSSQDKFGLLLDLKDRFDVAGVSRGEVIFVVFGLVALQSPNFIIIILVLFEDVELLFDDLRGCFHHPICYLAQLAFSLLVPLTLFLDIVETSDYTLTCHSFDIMSRVTRV